MPERVDTLVVHAHLLTMAGDDPSESLYEVAEHFQQTKEFQEILEYSLQAAELAEHQFSTEQALHHYTQAVFL